MRPALIALAVALLAAPGPADAGRARVMTGEALALDGDTILLDLEKIRLIGMDAPELRQTCRRQGEVWPCGVAARDALAGLIEGQALTCELSGRQSYGRALAVCRAAGVDIGAWLVGQGLAVIDPRFSTAYRPIEDRARLARRGVWAGEFQTPCKYRRSCE